MQKKKVSSKTIIFGMNVTIAFAYKPTAARSTYWVSSKLFSFPPVGVRQSRGQFGVKMLENGRGDT